MKSRPFLFPKSFLISLISVVSIGLGADAGAAVLLTPTIDGFSSEYPNSAYYVGGLIDGTPTIGSSGNLADDYASDGAGDPANNVPEDINPIVKFSFSTAQTIGGLGYAQRNIGPNSNDTVTSINLYFVSAATYAAYTPAPGTTPAELTTDLGESPSESIAVTADKDFDAYDFSSSSQQYIVAQFVDAAPEGEYTANPGGAELRFIQGTTTPEPSSLALLSLGLGVAWMIARRRRVF